MKPHSAIEKGKRLENRFASLYRSKTGDIALRTPGSGNGAKYKDDVHTAYFSVECKNKESHSIWSEWEQAVSEKQLAKDPVLVISGNYRPILVVMDVEDWLNLVIEAKYEGKI